MGPAGGRDETREGAAWDPCEDHRERRGPKPVKPSHRFLSTLLLRLKQSRRFRLFVKGYGRSSDSADVKMGPVRSSASATTARRRASRKRLWRSEGERVVFTNR
jgi:hypothetical protein